MFARTLKTAAIAAAVIVATAGASMAATWAYVDQDANVRKTHKNASMIINSVHEGQKVKVVGEWGNWYKLQIPGQDGWVKKHVIDFDYDPVDYPYGGYGGASFCADGKKVDFCFGIGF